VELADKTKLEGGELRNFLMQLDECQQIWKRVDRWTRDARVTEVLSHTDLKVDAADFKEEANALAVMEA
jgi:hypothetical protein